MLADEVQTFKALITIHKVLQEGHPIVVREAQQHVNWIDSLMRGVGGDGIRGMRRRRFGTGEHLVNLCVSLGYGPLIREYVFFLESKLAFHRNHPEFNGKESRRLAYYGILTFSVKGCLNTRSTSV